jgi:hypothetical protein
LHSISNEIFFGIREDASMPESSIAQETHELRFSSSATSGSWRRLLAHEEPTSGDPGKTIRLSGALQALQVFFQDCLAATNLVVLTGLGTSLAVNDSLPKVTKSAPTMGALWDAVNSRDPAAMNAAKEKARLRKDEEGNLEALLSRCKSAITFLGSDAGDGKALFDFVEEAEKIIRDACDFVDDTTPLPTHESFLQRIARRSPRKQRTKIFTTNYDLCFESAARRRRFLVVDGFSFSTPPEFDPIHFDYDIVRRSRAEEGTDYVENVFHLYKLHGSINWESSPTSQQIRRVEKSEKPLIIYPRDSKYEEAFISPYLPLMSSFQSILRQPETALIIVGFGFRDKHLAEPITAALATNLSLRVLVVDPFFFDSDDSYSAVVTNTLSREEELRAWQDFEADLSVTKVKNLRDMQLLARRGDTRIAFLKANFNRFVDSLPDLPTKNERDAHRERMDLLNRPSMGPK